MAANKPETDIGSGMVQTFSSFSIVSSKQACQVHSLLSALEASDSLDFKGSPAALQVGCAMLAQVSGIQSGEQQQLLAMSMVRLK